MGEFQIHFAALKIKQNDMSQLQNLKKKKLLIRRGRSAKTMNIDLQIVKDDRHLMK